MDDNFKLERLQNSFDELQQGVQVTHISETAQRQLRKLADVQEDVSCTIAQRRILKSLAFEGMHGRYDMVDEAHSKTFQWIFDDEYVSLGGSKTLSDMSDIEAKELREIRRSARERFINWLSSGEGIFHVSGKLGSGKSTLMKYLTDHPETKAELGKWAGK